MVASGSREVDFENRDDTTDTEAWVSGDDDDDDFGDDPTFDVLQDTQSSLSELSVTKSKSRVKDIDSGSDEDRLEYDVLVPKLDPKDEKCFERIEEFIQGGQLEKLKVDQCKLYLRKYGLRLTGKKEVLIARIREHLEVKDGSGEDKYPVSSFVINCKGDACTGDTVLFEQNVYDMFSIVSRSAIGAPCGTRMVAGRIVKESYGAAKQQHTFTIEVLWSKGVKSLPSLHPLLIKGRNLYRLKTMRQRWADEEERKKILLEKHSRGNLARSSRDTRLQGKEIRRKLDLQRIQNRANGEKAKANAKLVGTSEGNGLQDQVIPLNNVCINTFSAGACELAANCTLPKLPAASSFKMPNSHQSPRIRGYQQCRKAVPTQVSNQCHISQHLTRHNYPLSSGNQCYNRQSFRTSGCSSIHSRQPFTNLNSSLLGERPRLLQQISCRYYQQGRCRYGDACKWRHDQRQ